MATDVKQQISAEADVPRPQQSVTQEKQETLSAAKDRAQLTATTAMSVVHVALLKGLVDGGPHANRYYTLLIALIGTALAIQVVIGILAIFVTHTRNYYKKYRTDMCSETCSTLCCCFPCCDNSSTATGVANHGLDVSTVDLVVDETLDGRKKATAGDPKWDLPEATRDGLEHATRDVHLSMAVRLLKAELAAIDAEAELTKLKRQLEDETKQPDSSATDNGTSVVTNSVEAGQNEAGFVSVPDSQQKKDPKEAAKRMQEMKARMARCEETLQERSVLRSKNDLLCRYVGNTDANNILKKVQFWQNFINYLLYIVFICNAFITGMGVSGGQSAATTGVNGTTNGIQ